MRVMWQGQLPEEDTPYGRGARDTPHESAEEKSDEVQSAEEVP